MGRRSVPALLVAAALVMPVAPLSAQQPVQVTPQGITIDFQDADLRLVFAGLAEAGGLNLLYGDLPSKRVTLQMRQPVAKDAILPLLRNLARSNGVKVSEEGGFIRLETLDASARTAAASPSDSGGDEPRLFTYRLRHARAVKLSATLQSVFGGAAVGGSPNGLRPVALSDALRDQRQSGEAYGSNAAAAPATTPAGATSLPGRLHGEVQIVADEGTNALLVRALPADWDVIQAAITDLDLRPSQVLIEVLIAEVRQNSGLDVSVSGKTGNNATNPTATGTLTGRDNGALLLQLMRAGSTDQKLLVSMLASRGDVRIVSRPVLLAQNNLESRILVGEQRPFVQVSRLIPNDASSRDEVVQYRDVGTKLTLTPTINEDGYVNLEVLQEVSSATDVTSSSANNAPIISTREASTHLFLRDGQTGVIGGLMDREIETTRTGIPVLMDIPVLGWLFGSNKHTAVNNELFIFLTPHVLNDDADIDRVRHDIEQNGALIHDLVPNAPPLILPDSTAHPAPAAHRP